MQDSDQPPNKTPTPWAQNAGTSYTRLPPVASQIGVHDGWASFNDGFPPLNFLSVNAGGVPPFGQDVNGILHQVTSWQKWWQSGGPTFYDTTFAVAIGGYPKGAIVQSSTISKQWLCIADNNTANPDFSTTGWLPLRNGRVLNVLIYNVAGTYSYTPTNIGVTTIEVEAMGGGGAGGGAIVTTGSFSVGSGGGGGAYGRGFYAAPTSATTITVGSGGVAVTGNAGGAGTATSFGSLMTCPGGGGGLAVAVVSTGSTVAGQGSPSGDPTGWTVVGFRGAPGFCGLIIPGNPVSGHGASTILGSGGVNTSSGAGGAGHGWGSGGAGGASATNSPASPGGNGSPGFVKITEYS